MECFHAGLPRGPAADGKEAEAMMHFSLIPYGPRLSAVTSTC